MVVIFSERGGKWKNVVVLNYNDSAQKKHKGAVSQGILPHRASYRKAATKGWGS